MEIIGSALSPGFTFSSYRTKLFGIYTGTLLLQNLCSYLHIKTGAVTISCDNYGVLSRPHTFDHPITTSSTDFDLLYEIKRIQALLPITLHTAKVDAHLDLKRHTDFTFLELQNIRVDHIARAHTAHAALHQTANPPSSFLPSHQWRLLISKGIVISSP